MTVTNESCAIAIMAKAPEPGRSKTRLVPMLSFADAAALSGAFIQDMTAAIQTAAQTAKVIGYVAYAPAGSAASLTAHMAPATALLLADGASVCEPYVEGFGCCLLETLRALLESGQQSACVLNSDSPTLPASLLVRAARLLAEPIDRVVLGPATDGGYYLLGVRRAHAGLFADIPWSTEHVAEATRRQAARLGLAVVELEPWYDVDDAASLRRLVQDLALPEIAARAPATLAALAGMRPDLMTAALAHLTGETTAGLGATA